MKHKAHPPACLARWVEELGSARSLCLLDNVLIEDFDPRHAVNDEESVVRLLAARVALQVEVPDELEFLERVEDLFEVPARPKCVTARRVENHVPCHHTC